MLTACLLCRREAAPAETAAVRSNLRRFRNERFEVWRCATCSSLHCEETPDLARYYEEYPLRNQRLNYFTRAWFGVFLRWLAGTGLKREHELLDYGCGHGLFLQYVKERGFARCRGFDALQDAYQDPAAMKRTYDAIVSMDVIEHVESPRAFLAMLARRLRPGGLLAVTTPNASAIDLAHPEAHLHRLHMPCHRHILSAKALEELGEACGFELAARHLRLYYDHWWPCTSQRFCDAFMLAHGNDMECAFEPPRAAAFLANPGLIPLALAGYFVPGATRDHMTLIFRKPAP